MRRRLRDIVLLLRSLNDLDFQPETSDGKRIRLGAERGETATKNVPCPNCGGQGLVRVRGFDSLCMRCDAGGTIRVDGYTGRQGGLRGSEEEFIQHTRRVHCDACGGTGSVAAGPWRGPNNRCERCVGAGQIELRVEAWRSTRSRLELAVAENGNRVDPIIACMERRDKAGSFAELEIGLRLLRLELPWPYRCVVAVYVLAELEPEQCPPDNRIALGIGLERLSDHLPAEIRVPSGAREAERRRLERLRREVAA